MFHLWSAVAGPARRLPIVLLPALVLAVELVIVRNTVSADDVAGAALAVVGWRYVLDGLRARATLLAVLVVGLLCLNGLAPFELRASPAHFRWAPFAGALGGSMTINLAALAEKVFLYGSAIWLLMEAGVGRFAAPTAVAGLLAGIEAAQTRFAYHTPEITDPLLAILLAVAFAVLARWQRRQEFEPRARRAVTGRRTASRPQVQR